MSKLINLKNIKQFISYFFVGGIAAIVEWVMFFIFSETIGIDYLISTILAFIFSTTANWLLGRMLTFKDSSMSNNKAKEATLVFVVSAIGLLFNLLLMYIFVTVMGLNTTVFKLLSKVAATGIVFIWNFLARKLFIYREEK